MISLIITSQNRLYHLQRLLEGVSRNTLVPDEIILVSNDAKLSQLPKELPIKIVTSPYKNFPIGKNRNLGAAKVTYEFLFFLDVDCIPHENYFETLLQVLKKFGGLCMGNPKYLSHQVPEYFTYNFLIEDSIYHPHRPVVKKSRLEYDYALFWSLCFAISKNDFDTIGGFDDAYIGYGAEDTDFGFKAEQHQIPLTLSTAEVYHQQHPIYRPPVNHLEDIVYNSNVFYQKWGKWPMGGWLEEFTEKNWIDWNPRKTEDIQIIQQPTKNEIESYRQENARFV